MTFLYLPKPAARAVSKIERCNNPLIAFIHASQAKRWGLPPVRRECRDD